MKSLLGFTLVALLVPSAVQAERRCGWLDNPSSSNWTLYDKDAGWTIMFSATNFQAEGMDRMIDLTRGEYVYTNAIHGYACACMNVDTDHLESILKIHSIRQLPLSRCRQDPAIGYFLDSDK